MHFYCVTLCDKYQFWVVSYLINYESVTTDKLIERSKVSINKHLG